MKKRLTDFALTGSQNPLSLLLKKTFTAALLITVGTTSQTVPAASPTYIFINRPVSGFIEQKILDLKKGTLIETIKAEEKVTALTNHLFIRKNIFHNTFGTLDDPEVNLYAMNVKKGTRTRLNGELPSGGRVEQTVFSSLSKYAFYLADQEVKGQFHYYRTPGKKSKPVKLNSSVDANLQISRIPDPALPNGKGLTFRARYPGETKYHLYLSMLKESAPRRISIDMPNPSTSISGVFTNPRSTGIVYRANIETTHTVDYYYYDIKSYNYNRINLSGKPFHEINDLTFDRQGKNIYYRGIYDIANKEELYKLNLSTFETVKITPEIPDDRSAGGGIVFDKSGKKLYYTTNAYSPTTATYRLCYLDTKTYENHIVTPPDVDIYSFGLDGKNVVYYEAPDPVTTGSSRIFKPNPITGEAVSILNSEVPAGNFHSIQFDPAGEHILMRLKILNGESTLNYYQNLKTGDIIMLNDEPYNASLPFLSPAYYFMNSRWRDF